MRPILPLVLLAFPSLVHAAEADVALALPRTQYTTAEPVELALLSSSDDRTVPLVIRHADGSTLTFEVPFTATNQTRLVSVRPGVLKPGRYTASAGKENGVTFGVHPSRHPNAFWTAQWVHHGETRGTTLAKGGWMYLNSDLATLHPKKPVPGALPEWYVEASMRPFARMVLGGGHQLDLDLMNDWGDPWVQRTIAWRMQLAALSNRIYPVAGLHCFDEPGLTWWPIKGKDGKVIDTNPFAVPHQLDEFTRLTKKKLPTGTFAETAPQYAKRMNDWLDFMDLRMKYLEQAWAATVWGTDSVEPRLVTVNQVSSSYAPGTTTDGVDSRQARPYRVVSGHGGYSDQPFGTMQPVRSAEGFRGFGDDKPHYFLPMWYTHTWATVRNAVWMAWTTRLDGLMYTPEQDFGMTGDRHGYHGTHTVLEIAEINRRLARVGAALKQVPKTPAPVAVLHSHTQYAHDLATLNSPKLHPVGSPQYASPHRAAVDSCFFRVVEQGIAPNWIDEAEAAEKGATFLQRWKVILCPKLAVAGPALREALEEYAARGGKLVQFKGDRLRLKGSVLAEHEFGDPARYYEDKVKTTGNALSPAYRDLAWRKWNNGLAPTFAKDLAGWIGPQEFECDNKEILLGVHRARAFKGQQATYLLFANNAQSRDNPRGLKHELVAAQTKVKLPKGVVYDLFHGGEVPVNGGEATLRLAAGDGACWVHVPERVETTAQGAAEGKVGRRGGVEFDATYFWNAPGPLPLRVRLFDPAGKVVRDRFDATRPDRLQWSYLMHNADLRGKWVLEVTELWSGRTHVREVELSPRTEDANAATLADGPVSVYHGDGGRIRSLFAGLLVEPPYEKLNWDAKRVFGLDPARFAVFGPEAAAKKIAAALKTKGAKVEVNPKYEIKPFEREKGRGGAGVGHGVASNLENIYAHTLVLPGHPLLKQSAARGHVHREETPVYPGPGRAYVQWGIGCYQAGWQNVFVLGDTDAGVAWLLDAIEGKIREAKPVELTGTAKVFTGRRTPLPRTFVGGEVRLHDTPVGVGSSPDGKTTFAALHDGTVLALDASGGRVWETKALLEGAALAVSPKGNALAVAGYPGLLVLEAATGKILGGYRAPRLEKGGAAVGNRMTCAAWNEAGTLVAGGWLNPDPKTALDPVILGADGKDRWHLKSVTGPVMGVAFVPGSNRVLFGADSLTLVNADDGSLVRRLPLKGAQAFDFTARGKTVAAGGWGKTAAVFDLETGEAKRTSRFGGVVGGVAFLPDGGLAVAVWGETRPLMVSRGDGSKPEELFASSFGFQSVRWSPAHKGLVAAEQGGRLWLLGADGKPRADLREDAGTTAYRLELHGDEVLVARMNRAVQRIRIK